MGERGSLSERLVVDVGLKRYLEKEYEQAKWREILTSIQQPAALAPPPPQQPDQPGAAPPAPLAGLQEQQVAQLQGSTAELTRLEQELEEVNSSLRLSFEATVQADLQRLGAVLPQAALPAEADLEAPEQASAKHFGKLPGEEQSAAVSALKDIKRWHEGCSRIEGRMAVMQWPRWRSMQFLELIFRFLPLGWLHGLLTVCGMPPYSDGVRAELSQLCFVYTITVALYFATPHISKTAVLAGTVLLLPYAIRTVCKDDLPQRSGDTDKLREWRDGAVQHLGLAAVAAVQPFQALVQATADRLKRQADEAAQAHKAVKSSFAVRAFTAPS
ncbi:hypothetical protein ABPG75_000794 [Micractinium tetrahymenae]